MTDDTKPDDSRPPSRLFGAYRSFAVHATNTALLFIALNVIAALVLATCMAEEPGAQGALRYGMDKLSQVYPDRSEDEIREILAETWSRQYVYEPFTQFREGEYHGTYLNIHAEGFREAPGSAPWPPSADALNVFVFGGSTAFGYGVADDETIPHYLQQHVADADCDKPIAIYNFARSNYYSTQERILFEQLMSAGHRPAVAVFIDGLNDFQFFSDAPKFSKRLAHLMNESDGSVRSRAIKSLPILELLKRAMKRDLEQGKKIDPDKAAEVANRVVERWRTNQRLIRSAAEAYNVVPLFVWQPVPVYGYDLSHHVFVDDVDKAAPNAAVILRGYQRMAEIRGEFGDEMLWLADIQRKVDRAIYVDRVHYTPLFASEIALQISRAVVPRVCQLPEPATTGDAADAEAPESADTEAATATDAGE